MAFAASPVVSVAAGARPRSTGFLALRSWVLPGRAVCGERGRTAALASGEIFMRE